MRYFIAICLLLSINLYAQANRDEIFRGVAEHIPADKILEYSQLKGNYAKEFSSELSTYLRRYRNAQFVDYDTSQKVLQERLKYDEPVFDGKHSGMPEMKSPDLSIIISANRQKSNIILKQKEHLDYEITIMDLSTNLILVNQNGRIRERYNPPIVLLIVLIALVIGITRWIIHLKRGYNVMRVLIPAMILLAIIVVWYLL